MQEQKEKDTTVSKELRVSKGASETFTQSVEEMRALASEQSALVPYKTKSEGTYKMETLIPKNMSFEVQKALNQLTRTKGNIDNYVRNALKYVSTATLWKALAAEQVDGIGLYLQQFDRGQGVIIADQTGIGKGRQAAAVIRHAIMNGYLPVFFTKSPNLFSDMYRDLKAIGMPDKRPFILNTDSKSKIRDEQGHIIHSPLTAKEQQEVITNCETFPTESPEALAWYKRTGRRIPNSEKKPILELLTPIDHVPSGYDMIFTTYSQVQAAHPYKRDWIELLATAGTNKTSKQNKELVFILDESHLAGGYDSIIGQWMNKVLPKVKACCFLSATFAKYPEVMPFYGKKTAMLETGLGDEKLVRSMTKGGLALQEIVASNLAESGQLIRRQRSNDGIQITYKVLDKEPERSQHRERVNSIIKLMNEVVDFEQNYIRPILEGIHFQAKDAGESIKKKPAGLGVKQAPYFSRVFNIVDQMLFALKVEEVAKETVRLLREDKKVVIAFKSTMGTFLKELKLSSGDTIELEELDFVRTLIKGLDSVFYYNYTDITGAKTKKHIPLEELPDQGQAEYKRIRTQMLAKSSGLNISPIDQLIHLIESQTKPHTLGGHGDSHFKVAEVTGRNQRISFDMEQGEGLVTSFRGDAEKSFRLFNNGEYDVLLINQSGSTGASAHSSKDFKDQRQRTMIIHQFELDINVEMQKLGRINRTGQVNKPSYLYITSDIPLEIRLMTMLKAKLKMLDANTTGSQKTNNQTFESHDLFNKYGDQVAWDWIDDNPDMAARLGNPTYHKNWDGDLERNESKEGAIRQVTGRAGLLMVEDQEQLYKELLIRYDQQIILEKQQGTYDLETEFLPLDAQIKKRFLHNQGTGGVTPFGKDTIREETMVNNLNRPFTKAEIDQRILKLLDGKSPDVVQTELLEHLEEEYPKMVSQRSAKKQEILDRIQKDLTQLPELDSGKDEIENAKIVRKHQKTKSIIAKKEAELADMVKQLDYVKKRIKRWIGAWKLGEVVKVPFVGGLKEPTWGIFLGVNIGKGTKNPYTSSNVQLVFAVADARKSLTYSCKASEQEYISMIWSESHGITDDQKQQIPKQWNELIRKASSKREKRHILTQNIVAVSAQIGAYNKLIKYNSLDGTIRNGILMDKDFGKDKEHMALVPISNVLKKLLDLAIDDSFEDHQFGIRFKRIKKGHVQVYINKGQHYQMAVDPSLRTLLLKEAGLSEDELPNFVQNGGEMTGVLPDSNLEAFLVILDGYTIRVLSKARELEDWEIALIEGSVISKDDSAQYAYELGRSYGQGSNPQSGFMQYDEPNDQYPFGIVTYSRKLSDKEKYQYSLIPIFESPLIPFNEWRESIAMTVLEQEFEALLTTIPTMALYQAKEALGYFIYNHPHEDGNPEFVFGRHTPKALGTTAYTELIGTISKLDELVDQLRLYHKLAVTP